MRLPCDICGNYGHWKRDHNKDGSLKDGVLSIKKEDICKQNSIGNDKGGDSSSSKKTVTFSNLILVNSAMIYSMDNMKLGPLVDDGAAYLAIRIVGLKILYSHIGNVSDYNLNPVRPKLNEFTHL